MNLIELVNSMKLVRLDEDLSIIAKGIEENVQVEKDEKDNIFKKFGKNINNSIKKNKTEGLEKNKTSDEEAIEKIRKDTEAATSDVAAIEKEVESTLSTLEAKYVFSILYLLSDGHEYKDDEETLKKVSNLILKDENKLGEVKKNLNSHYNRIANGLFSSIKTSDAVILALQGYLLSLNKATGENHGYDLAKASIESLTGKEEDKKSGITMAGIILTGHDGIDFSDNEEGENAFFSLDKVNVQVALSINAYLISVLKPELNDEKLKKDVTSILTALSKLTLNCEKLMIIEKKDQENAKEKLSAINNYIADLATIL